ncbi:unannotated protein [freshwater metagenome]|uniref:Unannotated protein n=1 Tax=freshwater metagenome TaxID=449393 RepID=A0A6J7HJ33_9ZZZZ
MPEVVVVTELTSAVNAGSSARRTGASIRLWNR